MLEVSMENIEELKQAEAHLVQAEAELKAAETEERKAEHNVDEALEEIREALKPHEILLEIATPKGLFEGIFDEKTKISQVIEIVVDKKDLDKKDTFELVHGEKVLQPTDRTLESFGIKHKAKLELVATGSGV
jgi:sugar-specific transcriptional regulator TrmB